MTEHSERSQHSAIGEGVSSPMALLPGAVFAATDCVLTPATSEDSARDLRVSGPSLADAGTSSFFSASTFPPSTPPTPASPSCDTLPPSLVALHYGDPSGEQWALEGGRALVDRCDLRVLTVSGPDRQTWLTSMTTHVLTGMRPGDSRELLVLDPQGHIEHAAAAVDDGEATHLIVEGADLTALAAFLDSMRFSLRIDLRIRDNLSVFATAGSDIDTASGLPGHVLTWLDPWPGIVEGGAVYFQGTHPGASSRMRLHLVDAPQASDFVTAWFAADPKRRPAGLLAWEALRIAAWRPRFGYDTDSRSLPAELDWLRTAVHTRKGCYRGQESVARILNVGRPPRRLVFLHLDGSRGDLPERGTQIMWEGRSVGFLTSVARHAELGPIALALVSRTLPPDVVFDLDGVAAAQELIVPVEGKSSLSPQSRPGEGLWNPELRRPGMSPKAGLGGRGGLGGRTGLGGAGARVGLSGRGGASTRGGLGTGGVR